MANPLIGSGSYPGQRVTPTLLMQTGHVTQLTRRGGISKMKLEIITKRPERITHPSPVLFVHGAWHGAWCWEYFLPYFVEHGYEVHALSLRGHGQSEGRDKIRWFSIHDYVDDVDQIVKSL